MGNSGCVWQGAGWSTEELFCYSSITSYLPLSCFIQWLFSPILRMQKDAQEILASKRLSSQTNTQTVHSLPPPSVKDSSSVWSRNDILNVRLHSYDIVSPLQRLSKGIFMNYTWQTTCSFLSGWNLGCPLHQEAADSETIPVSANRSSLFFPLSLPW